jgi:flagellar motor switch protein FliM
MAEVLSQSEIDALLAALAVGDIVEEKTSNDSKNEGESISTILDDSIKFTHEDIDILEYIHKQYAEIISCQMFKNLEVKVLLESIQEIRFEEFMRSIPCPTVAVLFKLSPLKGYLLFETSPSLVSQFTDTLWKESEFIRFGSKNIFKNNKDMSMQITENFIGYLEKAWSKVLTVKAEEQYLETNPTEIKLLDNSEAIALLSFSISSSKVNGLFNICIPYSSIERYLNNLEIRDVLTKFELEDNLDSINLNIKVILDNIQLSVGEAMNLKKGMVLNTYKRYNNKVKVLVEENHCFNGEAGSSGNRKAVKIIDCLDKDV